MLHPRIAALAVALMFVPLATGARVIDRVAAVVNDEVILLSEVDRRCQAALAEVPDSLPVDEAVKRKRSIRKQTLDALIDERLLSQQVREHKVSVSDEDVDREIATLKRANNLTDQQFAEALRMEGRSIDDLKKQFRNQMEKRKLVDVQMRSNPEMRSQMQVGEKDIEEYYQAHYSKLTKVRASHILFGSPPGTAPADQAKVRERAGKVLDQIRAGAKFDEMAKQHSDDPSGSVGGDLGWFRRGDMVAAFEKAAFGLKKEQVSELVKTQFGIHIIKVTDRAEEPPPPVDKVRGKIQSQLLKNKWQRAMDAWLTTLRRQSFIDIKL